MDIVEDDQPLEGDMDGIAGHDMADLFGDAESSIPPELPMHYQEVAGRIDELSVNGCCQKLAWSSTGGIAHISRNGQIVNIHHYARAPDQAEFSLSKGHELLSPNSRFQFPLTHLAWSQTGNDLAVFDSAGGVAVYAVNIAINSMRPTAIFPLEGNEFEGAVVGVQWLRPDRTAGICQSASRTDKSWKYEITAAHRNHEPLHPVMSRSAFITISRNGTIRLFFGNATDANWSHVSSKLALCDSLESIITHASFAPGGADHFLLAIHSASSKLSMYEVQIDWHFRAKPNQPPPAGLKLKPTLSVSFFKAVSQFGIEPPSDGPISSATLTHLRLLPKTLESGSQQESKPTIAALFSLVRVGSNSALTAGQHSTQLVTMTYSHRRSLLHSSFKALAEKRGVSDIEKKLSNAVLERGPDVIIDGTVLVFESLRANTRFGFVKTDGVLEIMDRLTLQPCVRKSDQETICSVFEAGYGFPAGEHHTHYDLSPNGLLLVCQGKDDQIFSRHIERLQGFDGSHIQPNDVAAAAQGLIFCTCCLSHNSNDDVFSLLQHNLPHISAAESLGSLYSALSVNLDFVIDDKNLNKAQKIAQNPSILRCLSFQQALDSNSKSQKIPARTASVILELRVLCLAITVIMNDQLSPPDSGEVTASLLHVANWYTDFVSFLIDDVLEIKRALAEKKVSIEDLREEVNKESTPTLSLLLTSLPRAFLHLTSRYLRTLAGPQTPPKSFQPALAAQLSRSPIDIRHFEIFLDALGHYCREAYEAAYNDGGASGTSDIDARRGAAERKFLLTAEMPDALLPVAQRLLGGSIDKLVAEAKVDPMRLFIMDFDHLNLLDCHSPQNRNGDSNGTTNGHLKGNTVRRPMRDTLRKVVLPPTLKKWRRCTRCHGVMEDFEHSRGVPFWVVKIGRTCICGNMWMLEEAGE